MQEIKINKIEDKRGFSIFLEGLPIKKFHIVSVNPGAIRGDHSHDYEEILCIIGGNEIAEITLEDSKKSCTFIIKEKYTLLTIPPHTKHKVRNVGNKIFYLICFSGKEFE